MWSLTVHSCQSSPSLDYYMVHVAPLFCICGEQQPYFSQTPLFCLIKWQVYSHATDLKSTTHLSQKENIMLNGWKQLKVLFCSVKSSVMFDLRVASSGQTLFSSALTEYQWSVGPVGGGGWNVSKIIKRPWMFDSTVMLIYAALHQNVQTCGPVIPAATFLTRLLFLDCCSCLYFHPNKNRFIL